MSEESSCNAGDTGLIPGSGRSGGGHGNPLQCSCLENPMDRGSRRATVHTVAKSRTRLKRLSTHACRDQDSTSHKGTGTGFHIPQLRVCGTQQKVLQATATTKDPASAATTKGPAGHSYDQRPHERSYDQRSRKPQLRPSAATQLKRKRGPF